MGRIIYLMLTTFVFHLSTQTTIEEPEPTAVSPELTRQLRSYYDYRYGRPLYDRLDYARPLYDRPDYARPLYDRPDYARPLYDRLDYARRDYDRSRCGRCDDRSDEEDDDRDSDEDRRHRPTSGKRYDKKNYDEDDYNSHKNNTDNDDPKNDKDKTKRNRHRNKYDDRDRYRPDYYDRFLRDREYDRPRYDDYRRGYERYPEYDRYDPYARYDGYKRPYDDGYGGYGPSPGRGPHESFRPWDETYRGQSGWDVAGRGYYFASGRPDTAPAAPWGQPQYARPQSWQSGGYASSGYPTDYRGSAYGQSAGYGQNAAYGQSGYGQSAAYGQSGYGQSAGYRQDLNTAYSGGGYGNGYDNLGNTGGAGYGSGHSGTSSGWHSVGERRPYRDQSGVNQLDKRESSTPRNLDKYQTNRQTYGQSNSYDQNGPRGQNGYNQNGQRNIGSSVYDQNGQRNGGQNGYGQNAQNVYDQNGQRTYGSTYQSNSVYSPSSTTPETSYLFERDENTTSVVTTVKPS